jgi:hypothetical protein
VTGADVTVGGIAARAGERFARLRAEARAAVLNGATARRLAEEGGVVPAGCASRPSPA